MIYFSFKNKGFYDSEIHPNMPDDCKEISFEEYKNILKAQSQGKKIVFKEDGVSSVDKTIDLDTLKNNINIRRNFLLAESDWVVLPDAPFTEEQKNTWKVYRQELRDITIQEGYPENVEWPEKP